MKRGTSSSIHRPHEPTATLQPWIGHAQLGQQPFAHTFIYLEVASAAAVN